MQFLNVMVEGNLQPEDQESLFGPHEHECSGCDWCRDEEVVVVPASTDMFDLLVLLGAFGSKSQARKVWKKTGREIPPGFSHFTRIGKHRRELAIWNPTE